MIVTAGTCRFALIFSFYFLLNFFIFKSQLRDLESLLCATLQSVLRKMRPEDTPYIGDAIMQGLLQIMQRYFFLIASKEIISINILGKMLIIICRLSHLSSLKFQTTRLERKKRNNED